MVPTGASGVEGVDWVLGPGAQEITLTGGGQNVYFDMMIRGWNATGMTTYQASLDCLTFDNGNGELLVPILVLCTDAPGSMDCQHVDTDRADQVFNGLTQIAVCDVNTACADTSPGKIRCGSTLLFGFRDDDGGTYYAAQYAVEVPAGSSGQWGLNLDPDPDSTFITLEDTSNIVPTGTPGLITIPVGQCCGLGGNLDCQDGVTEQDCPLPGQWDPTSTCSGMDVNPADGLDDACCACETDAACDDGNACTDDSCADCTCFNVPNWDDTIECCDPATGVTTLLDDGEVCTVDTCVGGAADHAWTPGLPCDDGNGCTVNDDCQATEFDGCLGDDANLEYCDETTPCLAGACNLATNLCECSLTTDLLLVVHDSDLADGNCFDEGATVTVDIVMGAGSEVVIGGQFLLNYDPSCLAYEGIAGRAIFPMLIYEDA